MTTFETVFVDSSAWISYASSTDSNHGKALNVFQTFGNPAIRVFTSFFVVDETITKIRKLHGQRSAHAFFTEQMRLERKKYLRILPVTKQTILGAIRLLNQYPTPNTFSLTDATNVVLMKKYSISRLFTFDRDFKRFQNEFQIISAV